MVALLRTLLFKLGVIEVYNDTWAVEVKLKQFRSSKIRGSSALGAIKSCFGDEIVCARYDCSHSFSTGRVRGPFKLHRNKLHRCFAPWAQRNASK